VSVTAFLTSLLECFVFLKLFLQEHFVDECSESVPDLRDYSPASDGASLCRLLMVYCGCDQAVVVNVDTLLKCLCNLMCICFIYFIFTYYLKLCNVFNTVVQSTQNVQFISSYALIAEVVVSNF
jgi:hypothetical protein